MFDFFLLWHQPVTLWLQLLLSSCILFLWPLAKWMQQLAIFCYVWCALPSLATLLKAVPSWSLFVWIIFIWIQFSTKFVTNATFIYNQYIKVKNTWTVVFFCFFLDDSIYGWFLVPSIYIFVLSHFYFTQEYIIMHYKKENKIKICINWLFEMELMCILVLFTPQLTLCRWCCSWKHRWSSVLSVSMKWVGYHCCPDFTC